MFHVIPLALKQLSLERRKITFVLLALPFQKVFWIFFSVKMTRKNQNLPQITVNQKDLKSGDYNTDSTRITRSHQFGFLKPSLAPGEKKKTYPGFESKTISNL